MKTLFMAGILALIWTAPLAADVVTDSAQEAEGISEEDAEVITNLEFLESLEFLEENAVFLDDYEVLDEWEVSGNEQ